MPAEIECPGCQWKGPAPETVIGKKLRCPQCQNEFRVPDPNKPPLADDELELVEDDAPQDEEEIKIEVEEDGKDDRLQKKPRYHDDEDDDDRPRKKRRDRDDDDEYQEDRRKKKSSTKLTGAQAHAARQAAYLNHMAAYLYLTSLLLAVILAVLSIILPIPPILIIIPALAGLANWPVAIIGFIFALNGPRAHNALALVIATLSVAGVHFLFAIVALWAPTLSDTLNWGAFITSMAFIPFIVMIPELMVAIPAVAAILELARLILHMYVLGAHASALKETKVTQQVKQSVMTVAIIAGAMVVIGIIFGIVVRNMESGRGKMTIIYVTLIFTYACVIAMVFVYHKLLETTRVEFGE